MDYLSCPILMPVGAVLLFIELKKKVYRYCFAMTCGYKMSYLYM